MNFVSETKMASSSQNHENGESTYNINDLHHAISTHLYNVLHAVGASEEIRAKYHMSAITHEIITTAKLQIIHTKNVTSYIFGSGFEGSTTPGLESDMDSLYCNDGIPIVDDINNAPLTGDAFLLVVDSYTMPGYVKLQSVKSGVPQTISHRSTTSYEDIDHHGRILEKHLISLFPQASIGQEVNGPALTVPAFQRDFVMNAFRCRTIPKFADEWLHRPRPYQWPSEKQLQRMISYGCFFVGVSHPKSENKDTEWRISFSLQERELMSSLNPTQHKCYVLLKMIKKDIIETRVGKSLSSYHFKTCLFHLLHHSDVEWWTPNNLFPAVLECLNLLLKWVLAENCPNYFIKEENMFDRIHKSLFPKLGTVLRSLLADGVKFPFCLVCDDVGQLLELSIDNGNLREIEQKVKGSITYELYVNALIIVHNAAMVIHAHIAAFQRKPRYCSFKQAAVTRFSLKSDDIFESDDIYHCLSRAVGVLRYLEQNKFIMGHSSADVQLILGILTPHIRLTIAQIVALNALIETDENAFFRVYNDFDKEIELSSQLDLLSPNLIKATVFLQRRLHGMCEKILDSCEAAISSFVTSICGCHDYQVYRNRDIQGQLVAEKMTFVQFKKYYTTACMVFLPSEAKLVPLALRYEMYRSVYTPPASKEEDSYYWFDWIRWIVVDSKVYLYFLQYILYARQNQTYRKQDAVVKLHSLVDKPKENLGHRETALNLLGWIYIQELRHEEAFECFCRSWRIRPYHNAAKWHVLMLIHSLIV